MEIFWSKVMNSKFNLTFVYFVWNQPKRLITVSYYEASIDIYKQTAKQKYLSFYDEVAIDIMYQ